MPMVATLLVLSSAMGLALILRCSLFRGGRAEILNIENWDDKGQEIDIGTFRALLDRDDCQYLQESLSTREFKAIQRKRIRLALRILRRVKQHADLLTEVASLTKLNSDLVRRQQAEELIASAMQLRWNLLQVRFCLLLQWFIPSRTVPFPAFTARYEQLRNSLVRFQQYGYRQSNGCRQSS